MRAPASFSVCLLGLLAVLPGGECGAECVLKRVVTTPVSGVGVTKWLCCPTARAHRDCLVLNGAAAEGLTETDVGVLVRLVDNKAEGLASIAATENVKAKIQDDNKPTRPNPFSSLAAVSPSAIERIDGRLGRRLQTDSGEGAAYIDRTAFHGVRRILTVTVGSTVSKSGTIRSWPSDCEAFDCAGNPPIRDVMWGAPGYPGFDVGASPFSIDPACQDDYAGTDECLYSARDAISAFSRGAITLDKEGSSELYLEEVSAWPDDHCDMDTIIDAIENMCVLARCVLARYLLCPLPACPLTRPQDQKKLSKLITNVYYYCTYTKC
jgi:hypothetical protein